MYRYLKEFIVLVIFLPLAAGAQTYLSPQSISLAQTSATQSRGANVIGWNPANLGYPDQPGFSIEYGLIPLVPLPTVGVTNSTISVAWYNEYFAPEKFLTSERKEELVSAFPSSGLRFYQLLQARPIGLSFNHTAISVEAGAVGALTVPKPLFRFAFFGNEFDKPIALDDFHGEVQSVLSIAVAHGREVNLPVLSSFAHRTTAGFTVKPLIGLGYFGTESAEGSFMTSHESIDVSGTSKAIYAYKGFGLAVDAGVSAQISEQMWASLALNNLAGFIRWSKRNTRTYEYALEYNSTLDELTAGGDVAEQMISVDTSYTSNRSVKTPYPTYLMAGFQYDLQPQLSFYVNYKQGFMDRFDSSIIPRVSIAAKYSPLQWLPLRVGLAGGGIHGFQWGAGFGLEFNHYGLSLGFNQSGGFFNHATGFAFALGQSISF